MTWQRDNEAIEWARRIDDPGFADWDAHLAWLEADPENAAAFDRMVLAIDDAAEVIATDNDAPPANDNPVFERRSFGLRWGAGIAAGLAAVVGVATFVRQQPTDAVTVAYTTAPGQHRTFRLDDGSTIAMNGNSEIEIGRDLGRTVRIARGEIHLDVVHDASRPLEVLAGDATLRDVGTRFNVRREGEQLTVAVGEGIVDYNPDTANIRLQAGQELERNGHRVVVRRLDPGTIGSWRTGRLVYRDAPLPSVAVDLERAIGEPITVEPSAADVRFTGVLTVDTDHARVLSRLGSTANVRVRRDGKTWRVTAR